MVKDSVVVENSDNLLLSTNIIIFDYFLYFVLQDYNICLLTMIASSNLFDRHAL